VSNGRGLMAFTRIPRDFRASVQRRAKLRTAALRRVDAERRGALDADVGSVRFTEAPSTRRRSAFCTVKSTPFTLRPNGCTSY